MSSLDPRAPLVVDTRDLGRRPGALRTLTRTVPAPARLEVGLVRVVEGSDVALDLRLESVVDGVLVSGTAHARASGECGRCLEPVDQAVQVDLRELFVYPGTEADADAPRMQGDLLDLEPLLRDAVVLELPLQPVCRADCPGLCPECGVRLAEDPGHDHPAVDPRWAALEHLVQGTTDERLEK